MHTGMHACAADGDAGVQRCSEAWPVILGASTFAPHGPHQEHEGGTCAAGLPEILDMRPVSWAPSDVPSTRACLSPRCPPPPCRHQQINKSTAVSPEETKILTVWASDRSPLPLFSRPFLLREVYLPSKERGRRGRGRWAALGASRPPRWGGGMRHVHGAGARSGPRVRLVDAGGRRGGPVKRCTASTNFGHHCLAQDGGGMA